MTTEQSSKRDPYDRWGPRPPIFERLPVKVDDIKVVVFFNFLPYGMRPGVAVECLLTREMAAELRKTPGTIVPSKILDFRKWQDRGIVHLTEQEFTLKEIYFMMRWLSLYKTDLLFVMVHKDAHLMAKFFMDETHPSNNFVTSPHMKGSSIFNIINQELKKMNREPINWSAV